MIIDKEKILKIAMEHWKYIVICSVQVNFLSLKKSLPNWVAGDLDGRVKIQPYNIHIQLV